MSFVASIVAAMVQSAAGRSAADQSADAETIRAWVEQSQNGDMRAFRDLYDEFLPYVRRHIRRLLGPRPEVDDVVQDVFVEVYESIESFDFDSKFRTWLYRVTRNVGISHLRGSRKTVDLADIQPLRSEARVFSKLEARDQCRAMYAVLDQVSAENREAFLLHEVEEMKLREIAEMTDTSINTIASRVRRTREKLRTFLEATLSEETDE